MPHAASICPSKLSGKREERGSPVSEALEEPPTVLGALRELPQVLGAMRDAIMTGDTSALTIATIVFAATCVGLAIILANNRRKHENEDNAE